MAIDLQLKTKVHSAFNSAIVSNVRNGITVGGSRGTARGATGVNSLEGDLPDTSAAPQLAMREQGDAPSGRSVDSGGDRVFGRRRSSGGEQRADRPGDAGDIPVSSSGNPFDRSRFEEELRQKPHLREKMAHISLGENQNPRANLSVIETMMNRAVVRGTSLEAQVRRHRSSGVDEGGYYAGYAKHVSGEQRAMFDRNLDAALGQGGRGQSNVSGYATDNSSGALARRERATGAFLAHGNPVNGEQFFSPGRAEPTFRDRWQALNHRAAEFERNRANEKDQLIDPSTGGVVYDEKVRPVGPQSSVAAPYKVASAVQDPKYTSEDINELIGERPNEGQGTNTRKPDLNELDQTYDSPQQERLNRPYAYEKDQKDKTQAPQTDKDRKEPLPSHFYPPTPGDNEEYPARYNIHQDYHIGSIPSDKKPG